jgi:Tir chaperone protein (CesT) family
MAIEQLVERLAKELELEKIPSSGAGVFTLPLEEDLRVIISTSSQGLVLDCTLYPCPKERQEIFFTKVLLANLMGQGTKGAIIGLDEEAEKLTLHLETDYQVEYKEFRDIIEDFLNVVDFWREEAITLK